MKALSILLMLSTIGCSPKPTVLAKPISVVRTAPTPSSVVKRSTCSNKTITVAVIDTGFKISESTANAKLCKYGHKDFTSLNESVTTEKTVTPVPVDNHGHGTNIAGVIQNFAGNTNFCIVVIKYYDPKATNNDNLGQTVKAIKYATQIGVKYINYSGGGIAYSEAESAAVKAFLDKGGAFIAAAGNERSDLSKLAYYPAMDDNRITVVGSVEPNGEVARYSNYGKQVSRWEYGTNQVGFGVSMSGTSQAAAVATGKIINEECDK